MSQAQQMACTPQLLTVSPPIFCKGTSEGCIIVDSQLGAWSLSLFQYSLISFLYPFIKCFGIDLWSHNESRYIIILWARMATKSVQWWRLYIGAIHTSYFPILTFLAHVLNPYVNTPLSIIPTEKKVSIIKTLKFCRRA